MEPESELASVRTPQLSVLTTKNNHIKVVIYFMANNALTINGGLAVPAMGKVKLFYLATSLSGAYTSSQNLRKISFIFKSSKGLADNFEFCGQKT